MDTKLEARGRECAGVDGLRRAVNNQLGTGTDKETLVGGAGSRWSLGSREIGWEGSVVRHVVGSKLNFLLCRMSGRVEPGGRDARGDNLEVRLAGGTNGREEEGALKRPGAAGSRDAAGSGLVESLESAWTGCPSSPGSSSGGPKRVCSGL